MKATETGIWTQINIKWFLCSSSVTCWKFRYIFSSFNSYQERSCVGLRKMKAIFLNERGDGKNIFSALYIYNAGHFRTCRRLSHVLRKTEWILAKNVIPAGWWMVSSDTCLSGVHLSPYLLFFFLKERKKLLNCLNVRFLITWLTWGKREGHES